MSDLSNPNPKPVIINGIDVYNFMDFFFGCKVPMPTQPFAKQTLDDVDAYMWNNCEWGGLSDVSSDSSTARSETPLQYSDQANLDTESPRLHSYSSHGSIDDPSAMSLSGSLSVGVGSEEERTTSHILSTIAHTRPPPPLSRDIPLSITIHVEELMALGLVERRAELRPKYPSHLPFVRCCYDFNKRRGCGKGSNCYHIHANPADRRKPPILKPPFEVYVERPHFQLFEGMAALTDIESLPCQYGMNCRNPLHRECAIQYRFDDAALAEYNAYFRAFRDYEFQMIQQQLAVIRARRELTDDMIKRARSAHAAGSAEQVRRW